MKILITHAYSRKNFGDAAILSATIKVLRNIYPESDIKISSMEYGHDQSNFENIEVTHSFFGIAVYDPKNIVEKFIKIFQVIILVPLWAFVYHVFNFRVPLILNKKIKLLINEFINVDLIVGVGGGYYTGKNNLNGNIGIVLHSINILISKIFKKRIVMFPQSIGPFGNFFQKKFSKYILNLVDILFTRETISYETLKTMKVNKPKIINLYDMAFLEKKTQSSVTSKIKMGNNMKVGITVRKWLSSSKHNFYEVHMAKFIDYLRDTFNAQIIYIPQVSVGWANDDDKEVFQNILSRSKFGNNNVLFPIINDYRECKELCSKLDYMVSTRMHAGIFSIINYVPTIFISYEDKTIGIMHDLGLLEWVIKITLVTSDILKEKFEKLVENRKIIATHLNKIMAGYDMVSAETTIRRYLVGQL